MDSCGVSHGGGGTWCGQEPGLPLGPGMGLLEVISVWRGWGDMGQDGLYICKGYATVQGDPGQETAPKGGI